MENKKLKVEKRKKTRSRTPEKKKKQFERILEAGKQFFLEEGSWSFSMRGLAKVLNMNQNNLYNYIESKRELWIAIRRKFFEQYRNENIEILRKHDGSYLDLLLKIFEHFFKFAERDFSAFRMMHITPSPPSDKIGPFELSYEPFNYLIGTIRLIQKAIDENKIKEKNAELLTFFIYSMLLGATIVEYEIRELENKESSSKWAKIDEAFQFHAKSFTSKEFRKYVLKKINLGFIDPNLILKEEDYRI